MKGNKKIQVNGKFIDVSDEVYEAYTKGARKMKYFEFDIKTSKYITARDDIREKIIDSKEDSLERLIKENSKQFIDEKENVEEIVINKISSERLHKAISKLDKEEQGLIYALYFEDKTEREYAKEIGLYRNAVHIRKLKTLKKLKTIIE